ncbi:11525_t:CDS:1, partial [Cetraspora pellucida]
DDDIEKRTTSIIFHKGDEEKFRNMEWDVEYRKENINNINTVKIQNQKINRKIVYNNDGKIYFRQEFPNYIKNYIKDYPKSKPLIKYKEIEEKENLRTITHEFKKHDNLNYYLFFKKDNNVLNLDDFRYIEDNDENTSHIIVTHKENDSKKESFLINTDSSYTFYYKNIKFMDLEPCYYQFCHGGYNANHYVFLFFRGKKLEKIPDSFKCKFNENYIDKTTFEGKEVFETTKV